MSSATEDLRGPEYHRRLQLDPSFPPARSTACRIPLQACAEDGSLICKLRYGNIKRINTSYTSRHKRHIMSGCSWSSLAILVNLSCIILVRRQLPLQRRLQLES